MCMKPKNLPDRINPPKPPDRKSLPKPPDRTNQTKPPDRNNLPKPLDRTTNLRRSGNTKDSMIYKVEKFLEKKDEQPLKQKPWFYGNITRQQCIDLMQDQAMDGEFMIRESESNKDDFVLSMKTGIKVSGLEIKHLKIVKKNEEGFKMDGYDQMFSDLDELVLYFMDGVL